MCCKQIWWTSSLLLANGLGSVKELMASHCRKATLKTPRCKRHRKKGRKLSWKADSYRQVATFCWAPFWLSLKPFADFVWWIMLLKGVLWSCLWLRSQTANRIRTRTRGNAQKHIHIIHRWMLDVTSRQIRNDKYKVIFDGTNNLVRVRKQKAARIRTAN